MTSCRDFGYLATILLPISVVLRLVGLLHIFLISETTILTISRRSRGLGLFCLSKLCMISLGSFCHGIWKLSTQFVIDMEQLPESDEVVVDDAGEIGTEGWIGFNNGSKSPSVMHCRSSVVSAPSAFNYLACYS